MAISTSSSQPGSLIQPLETLSLSKSSSSSPHFPFLSLPSEIRNLIYATTYILSRYRSPDYQLPDFLVHGEGHQNGGILWMNIPSFGLLLVNKQVRQECLPMISPLCRFEIKTYAFQEARAWNTTQVLKREAALCSGAEHVLINLTPEMAAVRFNERIISLCRRVHEIVRILHGYDRLKEVTLRFLVSSLGGEELREIAGFLALARKTGVAILLELSIEDPQWMDRRELREEQRSYERGIQALTRKFAGRNAEVWIEWITVKDKDPVF